VYPSPPPGPTGPVPPFQAPPAGGVPGLSLPRLLVVAGLILVIGGLALPDGRPLAVRVPLWSLFAFACAAAVAVVVLAPGVQRARTTPDLAQVTVGGLVAFCILVVLPVVTSNAGFLVIAGTAASTGGVLPCPWPASTAGRARSPSGAGRAGGGPRNRMSVDDDARPHRSEDVRRPRPG